MQFFKPNFLLFRLSTPSPHPYHSLLLSYLQLRRAIGWLGISLAPVLLLGFLFLSPECPVPPSISHFYYTTMGTYFTGTLIAIALFLFFYSGPAWADRMAASSAAICSCIVAFCPTSSYCSQCPSCNFILLQPYPPVTFLHYAAALLLFLILAFFCLFLFTRTHVDQIPTPQKIRRNYIYRCCGVLILVSLLVLAAAEFRWFPSWNWMNNWHHLVLAGETVALTAFGISWLIKGAVFMRDH